MNNNLKIILEKRQGGMIKIWPYSARYLSDGKVINEYDIFTNEEYLILKTITTKNLALLNLKNKCSCISYICELILKHDTFEFIFVD
jgi:hypothetical protein